MSSVQTGRGELGARHRSLTLVEKRIRGAAVWCAALAAGLAGVALIGWLLGVEILRRGFPDEPPMKANAALGYLIASLALLACARSPSGRRSGRVVRACGLLVALIGVATLVEYVFSVWLGIDQLMFKDRVVAHAPYPGRPAANAALGLSLLGGALLCWERRVGRIWVANALAWLATIVGVLALAGYLTGAGALVSLGARQQIALNSTVALCVLSIGFLLARADWGEMRLLASQGQAGLVLRRSLPIAVGLPVFLAAATLAGRRLGLFSSDAAAWFVMSATIFTLIRFSWILARAAERAQKATARLARIVETSDEAIFTVTASGVINSWNSGAQRLYGYTPAQAIGQPITILNTREEQENREHLDAALAGAAERFESLDRARDGRRLHVAASISPIVDPDGEITTAACVARDITDLVARARLEQAEREIALAAASGEADPKALFDLVAARIADLLDAPAAGVVRFDSEWLTVVGWAGPSPRPHRLSRDEPSSTAEVARTGKTSGFAGYDRSAGEGSAFVASQGLCRGISTPVYLHGELWGCLSVTSADVDAFTASHTDYLERFADLTAAALSSAQAQADLRDEARLERALREVAALAAGEGEESELAALVAGHLSELLQTTTAAVLRAEADGLRIIGYAGPTPYPELLSWDEASSSAQAVKTGAPARLEQYGPPSGAVAAFAAVQGLRCGLSVPVRMGGRVWGAITVTTTREDGFSRQQEGWLERFVELVSAALANAQAQARLRGEARMESALREVAAASASGEVDERALGELVADRVAELLGVAVSTLWRFDEGWSTLMGYHGPGEIPGRVAVGELSVADRVRATGRAVRIQDVAALGGRQASLIAQREGLMSAAGVPIVVEGAPWGTLTVGSTEPELDPNMESVLGRFAELVAAALANAQARERLRFRARLEEALREVASASASGEMDERALAGLVAARIADLLAAPIVSVVRFADGRMTLLGSGGEAGLPLDTLVDERSATARVAQTQQSAVVDYTDLAPEYEELARANGGRAAVAVPVFVGGGLWGTLAVMLRPDVVASAAVELLERVAQLISAPLANAQANAIVREHAAVLGSLHDGVLTLDETGAVVEVNEPLCAMTGYSSDELIGSTPPYPFSVDDRPAEFADTHGESAVERAVQRKDGSIAWVAASVSTFTPADGAGERRAVVLKDVSDSVGQARLERAMRQVASASAEGKLDERGMADLAAAQIVELLNNPLGAVIRFDGPACMTVLGHAGEFPYPPSLDPEDSATVSAIVARTGKTARIDDYASLDGHFARFAVENGLVGAIAVPVHLDGALWGCLASMTSRPGGFPPAVEGLLERFAALVEVALSNVHSLHRLRQEARLEQVLSEVSAASAGGELDPHELFGLVAARVAELLDAPGATVLRADGATSVLVGSHGFDEFPDTLTLGDAAAATVALRTGRAARVDDYTETPGGMDAGKTGYSWGYRTALAAPVHLFGRPWGVLVVAKAQPHSFPSGAEEVLKRFAALVAVALAQADALAALHRQASTDELTGLLNQRSYQEHLQREFARARRHDRPLALVMLDLDGFKQVNDLHGHQAGDRVLEAVGRSLVRLRRASDIPCRIGGDEFAVIAPDTSAEAAITVAERLRAAAADAVTELGLPVTMSAGVTDTAAASTMHDLSHLADSAMYYAKHHGRNQTVLYVPGADEQSVDQHDAHRERGRALSGLSALARAIDTKDAPTRQHAERVADISVHLAARLGWSPERCARLREAALLHDVGKIGVSDALLTKVGRLTNEEYEQVKQHTVLGARIAQEVLDAEQVSWVRSHHERPDGRGYPDALRALEIPDGARVLGIADAFDAMTSGRSYQSARSTPAALKEMRAHAGTQFDTDLLNILEEWAQSTGLDQAGSLPKVSRAD